MDVAQEVERSFSNKKVAVQSPAPHVKVSFGKIWNPEFHPVAPSVTEAVSVVIAPHEQAVPCMVASATSA